MFLKCVSLMDLLLQGYRSSQYCTVSVGIRHQGVPYFVLSVGARPPYVCHSGSRGHQGTHHKAQG